VGHLRKHDSILLCELYKTLGCDTSVTVRLLSLATMVVPPRGDGVGDQDVIRPEQLGRRLNRVC
jgi:hypothetical protein